MSDYDATPCPMPDCGEPLHLMWDLGCYLYSGTVAADEGISVGDEGEGTWRVECQNGHVVLLPGPAWCDCDDPQGETCPHAEADYDWTDEHRTFTRLDMGRLRDLLAKMAVHP